MFTAASRGAVYAGQDPTGKRGFVRMLVTDMTPEEVTAWLMLDAVTARRFIDPTRIPAIIAPKIILDNSEGQPLPEIPTEKHERTTKRK